MISERLVDRSSTSRTSSYAEAPFAAVTCASARQHIVILVRRRLRPCLSASNCKHADDYQRIGNLVAILFLVPIYSRMNAVVDLTLAILISTRHRLTRSSFPMP